MITIIIKIACYKEHYGNGKIRFHKAKIMTFFKKKKAKFVKAERKRQKKTKKGTN